MKKVLLLAMTLFFAAPNMQAKENEDSVKIVLVKEDNSDSYYYEGVVPVEGVSKEEMYKRAKEWVLSTFKTGDVNSNFDEKELTIFNSPTILVKSGKGYKEDYVNFKLKILFKEGKYKFRFDNVIVKSNVGDYAPVPYKDSKMFPLVWGKYNENLVNVINDSMNSLSLELDKAIKANGTKKDDW